MDGECKWARDRDRDRKREQIMGQAEGSGGSGGVGMPSGAIHRGRDLQPPARALVGSPTLTTGVTLLSPIFLFFWIAPCYVIPITSP